MLGHYNLSGEEMWIMYNLNEEFLHYNAWVYAGENGTPVSYTHLDVYKRQIC